MKIRMLTFHSAHNYGALLQCHALYNELVQYGECEVIDYLSNQHDYRLIRRYKGWKNQLRAMMKYTLLKKRYNLMNDFIAEFHCTEPYDRITFAKHSFEDCVCVVGSDQVWSCRPNSYDKAFFLSGVKAKKKIAYAASMGRSEIPAGLKEEVGQALSAFSAISVREKSAAALLKKTYDLSVKAVLDPVFLQKTEAWRQEERPLGVPSKYILVYFLEVPANAKEVLESLKRKMHLPVLAITTINSGRKYGADQDLIAVGPREFLWLFDHAKFVVTSSFHGTAFSIVFEKQFYTLPKRDTAERMVDLLNSLGLQNRIIKSSNDIRNEMIDYKTVNLILQELKTKSKEFIRGALMDEA